MNPDEIRRGELERDRLLQVNRAVSPGLHQPAMNQIGRCIVCGNLMTPGLCCEVDALKKRAESLEWYLSYSLGQLEELATRPDTLEAWAGHEMIKEIRALLGKKKGKKA